MKPSSSYMTWSNKPYFKAAKQAKINQLLFLEKNKSRFPGPFCSLLIDLTKNPGVFVFQMNKITRKRKVLLTSKVDRVSILSVAQKHIVNIMHVWYLKHIGHVEHIVNIQRTPRARREPGNNWYEGTKDTWAFRA